MIKGKKGPPKNCTNGLIAKIVFQASLTRKDQNSFLTWGGTRTRGPTNIEQPGYGITSKENSHKEDPSGQKPDKKGGGRTPEKGSFQNSPGEKAGRSGRHVKPGSPWVEGK